MSVARAVWSPRETQVAFRMGAVSVGLLFVTLGASAGIAFQELFLGVAVLGVGLAVSSAVVGGTLLYLTWPRPPLNAPPQERLGLHPLAEDVDEANPATPDITDATVLVKPDAPTTIARAERRAATLQESNDPGAPNELTQLKRLLARTQALQALAAVDAGDPKALRRAVDDLHVQLLVGSRGFRSGPRPIDRTV
jgi:hypothetical protein